MNFNSLLFNIFAVPNHLFLSNRSSCRFIELEIKPCRLGSGIGDMEELSCSKQQQSHTAPARISCWDLSFLLKFDSTRFMGFKVAIDNQTNSCFFSTRSGVFGSLGSILFTPNSFCFMNITKCV